MQNNEKIMSVETRNERTHYTGVFKDFQSFGDNAKGSTYSQQSNDAYSEYQNFLYKRAMFGLKMYTPQEIKAMHWQKRQRIQKVQERTQTDLNTWKQNKIIAITNKIFGLFCDSSFAQEIIDIYSTPDPTVICKIPFKDLGITKDDIVHKLLDDGLLPHNFMTLK